MVPAPGHPEPSELTTVETIHPGQGPSTPARGASITSNMVDYRESVRSALRSIDRTELESIVSGYSETALLGSILKLHGQPLQAA